MILIRILSKLNFQFKQGHSAFYSEKSDWRFDILFQVFVTRLTLIVKTWRLLKPTFTDKNNLASFRLLINDKENKLHIWEMHEGVATLIHFLLLPTDGCC
jgi:hypothetical protein